MGCSVGKWCSSKDCLRVPSSHHSSSCFIYIYHSIDFSTTESFNRTLSAHLTVIIVDTVDLTPDMSKAERVRAMEAREGFYQTQLKTLTRFGGMNTLDSHHNLIRSGNI